MKIRAAASLDLSAIKALLEQEGLPSSDVTGSLLNHFLVAEDANGAMSGCVGLELSGSVALLRSLAVAGAARRAGLGNRLVSSAESLARHAGVSELWLLTTTAASFFLSVGYGPVERDLAPKEMQRSRQFAHLCPASAICMMKTLATKS
ncbi:arsenic resistance N-acetyltransferase ArsN2 [Paraburkholderia strydomiana]|uniref:arsenic resistance N-acetyltransferase ArsN2 n=1 Tax=Paraburkholderia strydomiana TaxID=1245417 RepID=UPI001BEC9463|nr:arsenic resistance N-acetyltransferase ArsN2 [Paraburkholderia strydomiana]MBT2791069.1 GNAT family N-acetyltransferase [Paraburkholderia strydomiana]